MNPESEKVSEKKVTPEKEKEAPVRGSAEYYGEINDAPGCGCGDS